MSSASDTFTFGNLGAAKLLPGSMCFVSGCYKNEIAGESDLYVKTPITECTIQGEVVVLSSSYSIISMACKNMNI